MSYATGLHNFYDEDGRPWKDHPGYKEVVCIKCGGKFLIARNRFDTLCESPQCGKDKDKVLA